MTPLLILTPLILLTALASVWLARPVHAALLLSMTLAFTAVFYLMVGAEFIGLVQFMVYVGAVAVLIVFSLLITRPGDEAEEIERRPHLFLPGLACVLPVMAVLLHALWQTGDHVGAVRGVIEHGLSADRHLANVAGSASDNPSLGVESFGSLLFTSYAPAVLAVAVLLTAVMIGAALFARDAGSHPQPPSAP